MKLRSQVLYRVERIVRNGDAFCQIILEQNLHTKKKPFRVKVFAGIAGTPPRKPNNIYSFEKRTAAEIEFDNQNAIAEANGFCLYDPTIHGLDRDF